MLAVTMAHSYLLEATLLILISGWRHVDNGILAQRAPCFECELFKEQHPEVKPYLQIRSHCTYPCECPPSPPSCAEGVHLITDGCGCCKICARQQREPCNGKHLCDEDKGLVCEYPSSTSTTGTCQVIRGASCKIGNLTFIDGETFKLDCRTQCTCQNGSYGCVSLCAQEKIRPSAGCSNPRLIEVPGRCCREWMCDSQVVVPKDQDYDETNLCEAISTDWSPCSTTCGMGVSLRLTNDNEACQLVNETRLCQIRTCEQPLELKAPLTGHHHIRRHHFCRATIHPNHVEKLRYGNCTSFKPYLSKHCGHCGSSMCCVPQYTTTLHVAFQCPYDAAGNGMLSSSSSSIVTYPVMSILKCVCPKDCLRSAYEEEEERNKDLDDDDNNNEGSHNTEDYEKVDHNAHRIEHHHVEHISKRHRVRRRKLNFVTP